MLLHERALGCTVNAGKAYMPHDRHSAEATLPLASVPDASVSNASVPNCAPHRTTQLTSALPVRTL